LESSTDQEGAGAARASSLAELDTSIMDRGGRSGSGQSWSTFLRSHAHVIAARDLFTVPTLSFKVLHVFVAMSHDRRRILGLGVTACPTSAWVAKQISAALGRCRGIRLLVRDNDSLYTGAFLDTTERALTLPWIATRRHRDGHQALAMARSSAGRSSAGFTTSLGEPGDADGVFEPDRTGLVGAGEGAGPGSVVCSQAGRLFGPPEPIDAHALWKSPKKAS